MQSLSSSTINKSSDNDVLVPVIPPNITALFSPTVISVKSSHGGGVWPVTAHELHRSVLVVTSMQTYHLHATATCTIATANKRLFVSWNNIQMNINEQNYFGCLVQQSQLNSTKVAVKHHNVGPRIVKDSRRNLQSTKRTHRHERCTT